MSDDLGDIREVYRKGLHDLSDDPQFLELLEKYNIHGISAIVVVAKDATDEFDHEIKCIQRVGAARMPSDILADAISAFKKVDGEHAYMESYIETRRPGHNN